MPIEPALLRSVARWLLLTGVLVSAIQFTTVLRSQSAAFRAELTNVSVERATRLRNAVSEISNTLDAFAAYFAASQGVDQREFEVFAGRLNWQVPGIESIGWAPQLPPELKAEYELGSERFPGRPLLWFAAPGKFLAAGDRETYFPLSFLASPVPNYPIGLDLLSIPRERDAIQQAIRSRTLAISSPIALTRSEDPSVAKRNIALYPVYGTEDGGSLIGFVTAVLNLPELMDRIVAEQPVSAQDLYLVEVGRQGRDSQLIHQILASGAGQAKTAPSLDEIGRISDDRIHFSTAGSQWQLYSANASSPIISAFGPAAKSSLLLLFLFSAGAGATELGSRLWRKLRVQRQMDTRLIHRLREYDPVTDLPNRESLLAQLKQHEGESAGVLIVNLRRFRRVVEALDSTGSDQVLREVARRIARVTPMHHFLARLGGDEFALLAVGDDAEAEQIKRLSVRVRTAIRGAIEVDGKQFHLDSVVAGALVSERERYTGTDILSRATLAMRVAKSKGQAHPVVFDSDSSATLVRRQLALERALDQAIRDRLVEVRFQPQFNTGDLSLHGFESLVRWSFEGERVHPPEIFSLAQEGDRLEALDDLVIDQAIELAMKWRELDPGATGRVAINMPADHFCQEDFASRLVERLKRSGVEGDCIGIELTESTLIEDVDRANQTVGQLRSAGIEIALDDFGTGYSSLSHLRQLPVQWLKLERQFVTRLCEDEGDAAIVRATIDLARSIHAGVVAEGVETHEQLDRLREMGCDAVQGYLFSSAVPAQQALGFVRGFRFEDRE